MNAFEAERRRIERDLHDGAQQRLVALSMSLGLARLDLPEGPAADQVAHAHEQAKLALTELRELIYGIYPQVLTDRGLRRRPRRRPTVRRSRSSWTSGWTAGRRRRSRRRPTS